jgi:hypothetical protein
MPAAEAGATQREVTETMNTLSEEAGDISVNPVGMAGRVIGKIPGGVGRLSWQALRLPGVAFGQRAGPLSKMANLFKGLGIDRGTFRQGPFSTMIDAKMWTDYLNNLDMQDVGAELSSSVSPEEKLTIFRFCKEWEDDQSHIAFRKRLYNTPDVNAADEIAKGNIVFDLMTGRIPGPGLPANVTAIKHDKMYRLAIDIIHSMRLRDYNFYSLNLVHAHEGSAVYDEFMDNYVPLEPSEVEVVQEIAAGISDQGRSYAFTTTTENGDPMGAFDLMQRTVHYYNGGDTVMVRTILDTLFAPPFNYKPEVGYTGLFDPVDSKYAGQQPLHLKINGVHRWMMPHPNLKSGKDGKVELSDNKGQKQFIEVLSYSHPKPVMVWTKLQKKGWESMPYDDYVASVKQAGTYRSREGSDRGLAERVRSAQTRLSGQRTGGGKPRADRGARDRDGGGRGGGDRRGRGSGGDRRGGGGGGGRGGSGGDGEERRVVDGVEMDKGEFVRSEHHAGSGDWSAWDDAPQANPSIEWLGNPTRSNMAFDAPAARQAASAKAKETMMNAFTEKYLDPTFDEQIEKGERPTVRLADRPVDNAGYQEAQRLALAYDPNATGHSEKAVVLGKVLSQAYKTAVKVTHDAAGPWYYTFTMDRTVPSTNPSIEWMDNPRQNVPLTFDESGQVSGHISYTSTPLAIITGEGNARKASDVLFDVVNETPELFEKALTIALYTAYTQQKIAQKTGNKATISDAYRTTKLVEDTIQLSFESTSFYGKSFKRRPLLPVGDAPGRITSNAYTMAKSDSPHSRRLKEDYGIPNPKKWGAQTSLGRGKAFHIVINPKASLTLKQKAGKGGSAAKKHGDTGGLPRGIKLGTVLKDQTYAMYGIHKRTGTREPYYIKIPSKFFRAVTLTAEQSPTGKSLRTLMPMKQGTKKGTNNLVKAWEQFLSVYGYPRFNATKADPVRYTIVKESKGSYYDKLRAKAGKGKK